MRTAGFLAGIMLFAMLTPVASAGQNWPGEPIDNHVHLTWATLTLDVNDWADENPDIVDLTSIGQSYVGKTLWVVRL